MALWFWKKTRTPGDDTRGRDAYHDNRQLLFYQQWASAFDAPIVKNMAAIKNINLFQGPQIMVAPAVGISGYGGIVAGQSLFQPLQDNPSSSGGL